MNFEASMGEPQDQLTKIIDCHCHIASVEHTPMSFIEASVANMVSALSAQGLPVSAKKLTTMFINKMQDPLGDSLVLEMKEAGISKTVLLIPDFTYALKDCKLTIEESFLRHCEVMLRHPGKFEVFGGVDPRWGKDGLVLFERSLVEFKFRGLKVYPPCGFSPSDASMFPYYELCAHHRVPVLLHTGPTSPVLDFSTSSPFLIDKAARLFPSVNFILAHGAVSYVEECIMLCRFRPNIYLDISGYQATLGYDPAATAVKNVVSVGINHKVLFGTDFPVFRLQGEQKNFLEPLTGENGALAELNEREKSLIFHRNIERLLETAAAAAA
jgi:predicted TIM-barrel fold metal-dependent hydrolase